MLWLALAGRDGGVRCSDLLGVRQKTVALDFDLACAYRLLQFENKREKVRFDAFKQVMKEAIVEALIGKQPDAESSQEADPFSNIPENDVM